MESVAGQYRQTRHEGESHPHHQGSRRAASQRMKALTVELILLTASMTGCASTTAESAGAAQDDATSSASFGAPATPSRHRCSILGGSTRPHHRRRGPDGDRRRGQDPSRSSHSMAVDLRRGPLTTSSRSHLTRRRPWPDPTPRGAPGRAVIRNITTPTARDQSQNENQSRNASPIGAFRASHSCDVRWNSPHRDATGVGGWGG